MEWTVLPGPPLSPLAVTLDERLDVADEEFALPAHGLEAGLLGLRILAEPVPDLSLADERLVAALAIPLALLAAVVRIGRSLLPSLLTGPVLQVAVGLPLADEGPGTVLGREHCSKAQTSRSCFDNMFWIWRRWQRWGGERILKLYVSWK